MSDEDLRQQAARLTGELEAARAQIERLSFTVAHELRAPLRHIGAFAQVIEEDHGETLDAAVRGHLKTIQDAAEKMSCLLDGLQDDGSTIVPTNAI